MRKFVAIFVPIIATFLLYGCNINNTHTNEYEEEESISIYEYTRLGNLLIKFPDNWIKEDLGNNQYKLDSFTNLSISDANSENSSLHEYVINSINSENLNYKICSTTSFETYITKVNYKESIIVEHKILNYDNNKILFYKQCIVKSGTTVYIISLISTTNFGISDNNKNFIKCIDSIDFY